MEERVRPEASAREGEPASTWLALLLLSPLAGALAGLVGALFRLSLERADALRDRLAAAAGAAGAAGLAASMLAVAALAALAAWMVRRFAENASGSGIPHVEAVLAAELPQAPFRLVPVKFAGGVLAIGSGLALGREGPSVQMGATLAHLVGRLFRRDWQDCRILLAAGAGAGLATAFNAPIAGAIFVLEELVRRFEPRIAIAALGASATAIAVSRAMLGAQPDFDVAAIAPVPVAALPLFFILGAIAGLAAVAYNRAILGALDLAARLKRLPAEGRAALIGAAVGLLLWAEPAIVGGGDGLTQAALSGAGSLAVLPLLFLARFALGAASYAAATPGGLFAPMLVLGAELGLWLGLVLQAAFPALGLPPEAFAVVAMAAFFTGVVRAPLTGIVLVTEMTGNVSLLLPMLAASFLAMLVPTALRDPPIYDSLKARLLASSGKPAAS
jgi:CIC family chloride channel protein